MPNGGGEPNQGLPRSEHLVRTHSRAVPGEPSAPVSRWHTHHHNHRDQLFGPPLRLRGLLPRNGAQSALHRKSSSGCHRTSSSMFRGAIKGGTRERCKWFEGGTKMAERRGWKQPVTCQPLAGQCLPGHALFDQRSLPCLLWYSSTSLFWGRALCPMCTCKCRAVSAAPVVRWQGRGSLCPWDSDWSECVRTRDQTDKLVSKGSGLGPRGMDGSLKASPGCERPWVSLQVKALGFDYGT